VELPLLGAVAAGLPIEAIEEQETLAVPHDMLRGGNNYVLRVRGDSMVDEQIRDGDYIVVNSRQTARTARWWWRWWAATRRR
jgi:repressor LexA